MLRLYAAIPLAVLGLVAPPAVAATRSQAERTARVAANRYTTSHFGIGGPSDGSLWRARCRRHGRNWACSVRMNGDQCTGTLEVSFRLKAYRFRIGCAE